jgi:TDG/mug DNA glycosylase family protein
MTGALAPAGSNASLKTLPDYLAQGLDVVFVGINPSLPSAQQGHYYANPRNRFWRAFNLAGMAPEPLGPETDYRVLEFGMGFTDLVKRPTRGMAELAPAEFRRGAVILRKKLLRYRPRFICFQGITAYRGFLRHIQGPPGRVALGLQANTLGPSGLFVVPSPSPANAVFSLEDLVSWYQRLKRVRDGRPKTG